MKVRVRDNEWTRFLVPALAAAVTLTACGGSSAGDSTRAASDVPPRSAADALGGDSSSPGTGQSRDYRNYYPPGTHKPSRTALRVITRWSDELRAGHIRKAAKFFAVPALVQNASPVLTLANRQDVYDWNRTLPCGAHVVKAIAGARYTVATFVLTERPGAGGGNCGATGKLAATAFRFRDGKIAEWRRVLVPPPLGPEENLRGVDPNAT